MGYALVFPGQGSQSIGMGKSFYDDFSYVREGFEEASDTLKRDMKSLLFEENSDLNQSLWTQPAILVVSVLAFRVLQKELGLKPEFVMGHSLGEISSVCVANGLEFSSALKLVHERGKLMQSCGGDNVGMMVVMGMNDDVLEKIIAEKQAAAMQIWVANYNSDGQVVLAGIKSDLQTIEPELKAQKAKRALLLDMSVASHCPLLQGMIASFKELLQEFLQDSFIYPIVSNVTTQKYQTKEEAIKLLCQQLTSPVRYKQSVAAHEACVEGFIECGHGNVLKGLNSKSSKKITISFNASHVLNDIVALLKKD